MKSCRAASTKAAIFSITASDLLTVRDPFVHYVLFQWIHGLTAGLLVLTSLALPQAVPSHLRAQVTAFSCWSPI